MQIIFILLLLVGSRSTFAANEIEGGRKFECETQLTDAISPSIQNALKTFPNIEEDERTLVTYSKSWSVLQNALKDLEPELEAVGLESLDGGLEMLPFDHRLLLGLPIVGVAGSVEGFKSYLPAFADRWRYFSGVVVGATVIGPSHVNLVSPLHEKFLLAVQTDSGLVEVPYTVKLARSHLFVLRAKLSPEESLTLAFKRARYDKWITRSFGPSTENMDYEVASQALHLYFSLPPEYGIPATVNTLRGQKEVTREHRLYGALKDSKRYSAAKLDKFLRYAQAFVRAQKVETKESFQGKNMDFQLDRRKSSDLVTYFLSLVDAYKKGSEVALTPTTKTISTVKDFEKAAMATLKLDDIINKANEFFGQGLGLQNEDVIASRWPSSFKIKLSLVSKSKAPGGTIYRYLIKMDGLLHFDVRLPDESGRKHVHWVDLVPFYEVQFGDSPGAILSQRLEWTLSSGNNGSTFAIAESSDGLKAALLKFFAE